MHSAGADTKPEKYSQFKNRIFEKYINKIKGDMQNIKCNSLKKEDKIKLKDKLLEIINEQKFN